MVLSGMLKVLRFWDVKTNKEAATGISLADGLSRITLQVPSAPFKLMRYNNFGENPVCTMNLMLVEIRPRLSGLLLCLLPFRVGTRSQSLGAWGDVDCFQPTVAHSVGPESDPCDPCCYCCCFSWASHIVQCQAIKQRQLIKNQIHVKYSGCWVLAETTELFCVNVDTCTVNHRFCFFRSNLIKA